MLMTSPTDCAGWDWSQYSTTQTLGGLKYLSLGVWKSVYLVQVDQVSLRAMTAHVFYEGEYPTAPLTDATAGPFSMQLPSNQNRLKSEEMLGIFKDIVVKYLEYV